MPFASNNLTPTTPIHPAPMNKLNIALNAEIIRLARKEVKQAVTPLLAAIKKLKAGTAKLKAEIAALKAGQTVKQAGPKLDVSDKELKAARFSGGLIMKLRKRLGLSRAQMGKLVGVSEFAIMGWERGDYRPKTESQKALIVLRKTSKAQVKKMVEEGRGVV